MTPETCCGARCRHCVVWPTLEDLPSKWCGACRCTVYVDDHNDCIPCGTTTQRVEKATNK